MDSEASGHDERCDGPVTVDLLADLQAGLLDDQTASGLRHRARTDPVVASRLAALDRVRREVADLGVDAASAPAIPADVTARIGTALRNEAPPANPALGRRDVMGTPAVRHPPSRLRTVAAAAGLAAVVAAGAVGTTMLVRIDPSRPPDAGRPASHVPMSGTSGGVPLSDAQILALLTRPPDLGTLVNPQRRVSCLSGLGYPTGTSVLGARPLDVRGNPGELLLLPGDASGRINAVVVAPNCSAVDTGLLAGTMVNHT